MGQVIDVREAVFDFVDSNCDFLSFPLIAFRDDEDACHCLGPSDLADAFFDYLSFIGFTAVLEEKPGAIARLDLHFEVYLDEYVKRIGGEF